MSNTDNEELEDGILLSQDEMDSILADVRTISKQQGEEVPGVALSQNELDALFSGPKPAISKPLERPKQISLLVSREKWTSEEIKRFNSGEELPLDILDETIVDVLADGHEIAKGKLLFNSGRYSVKIVEEK